jgi:hypothetical protein
MGNPQRADAAADIEVLHADDPRCLKLEAAGYRLVGESWGARLRWPRSDRPSVHRAALARAAAAGPTVRELGAGFAGALHALEVANHADYPATPATAHELRGPAATRALWTVGGCGN